MASGFKRLTDFLVGLGVEQVGHTGKSYLAHLVGVYRLMESCGCPEEVCRAGMFHSLYGTERFRGFTLPLARRPEVRALIGERAERLAYLNCAMERATFDRAAEQREGPYRIVDRLTGEAVELGQDDFDDLCRVHLYDWLEQVPRSQEWDYRRAGYRRGGVVVRRRRELRPRHHRRRPGLRAGADAGLRRRRRGGDRGAPGRRRGARLPRPHARLADPGPVPGPLPHRPPHDAAPAVAAAAESPCGRRRRDA